MWVGWCFRQVLSASLVHWPLLGKSWRADHYVKNYLSLPFVPSQVVYLLSIYLFINFETKSPCVAHADLEFKMCLPQSPTCWNYRCAYHTQLYVFWMEGKCLGGRGLPLPVLSLELKGSWERAEGSTRGSCWGCWHLLQTRSWRADAILCVHVALAHVLLRTWQCYIPCILLSFHLLQPPGPIALVTGLLAY